METTYDYNNREELIAAIIADDQNRPAAAILVEDMLVGYHSSNTDAPYDVFVFAESFLWGQLQKWQEKMLDTATKTYFLGSQRVSSLAGVWACTFGGKTLTPQQYEILADRFAVKNPN